MRCFVAFVACFVTLVICDVDTSIFNDDDWQRVATADVEDDGDFYECVIYEHKTGGGHCIYFGEDEYEGVGKEGACGTYSFQNGVLIDSDGDVISAKNFNYGRIASRDYAPSSESSDDSDSEVYSPSRRGRGRGRRGRGGRGRGRGRRAGRGRGRSRAALPAGQHECSSCHLRAECVEGVSENHDRHFPWCSKYVHGTSWEGSVITDVAKEEVK